MAKKLTLYSFQEKPENQAKATDKNITGFLKILRGKLLIVGAGQEAHDIKGFDMTVIDPDLARVQECRKANPNAVCEYADFPSFARRCQKNTFDVILDNTYSNTLHRSALHSFYHDASKLLKFNGTLLTKAYSIGDTYCTEHCPLRHWTYVGDKYLNFFSKKAITKAIERHGFVVESYVAEPGFHVVNSRLKIMKL
jgi:hypothetical protein